MKYLIDANFVAIRRGAFIKADEKAGEFILDTEEKTLKKAVLDEIAKANKIKSNPKLGVSDTYQIIEEGLSTMSNIPEQNSQTESDKVKAIVEKGFADGKSEDQVLVLIVTSGVSYKKAGKLYRDAVESLGLAVNTKDLKTSAGEIMAAAEFSPKTHEEFEGMQKTIQNKFPKAEIGQISSVIRRYLRANKIEIPAAPKGQRGATGFRKVAFDFMLANPTMESAAFKDWVVKEKGKDEKLADKFVEFFDFAKQFASASNAPAKAEAKVAKKAVATAE